MDINEYKIENIFRGYWSTPYIYVYVISHIIGVGGGVDQIIIS